MIKKIITDTESKAIDVTPTIAPLTFMIASCPLLLGLIKHEKKGKSNKWTMDAFISTLNSKLDLIAPANALDANVTCAPETWTKLGETSVSQPQTGNSPAGKKSRSKPNQQGDETPETQNEA